MLEIVFNLPLLGIQVEKEGFIVVEAAEMCETLRFGNRFEGSLQGGENALLSPEEHEGPPVPDEFFLAHAPFAVDLGALQVSFFDYMTFADQFFIGEYIYHKSIPVSQ